MFQLTAARRRLGLILVFRFYRQAVSTHSRPKAAGHYPSTRRLVLPVSTHSRPKAAGSVISCACCCKSGFQLTAARRRLGFILNAVFKYTHRFNSQPPEGGWLLIREELLLLSCFNSQPPEGGWMDFPPYEAQPQGFNSQPPEGGWKLGEFTAQLGRWFQLTAARRRLVRERA